MTSSTLAKMAKAAAVIRDVIGQDFECHGRKEWDGEYGKDALLILKLNWSW